MNDQSTVTTKKNNLRQKLSTFFTATSDARLWNITVHKDRSNAISRCNHVTKFTHISSYPKEFYSLRLTAH